MKHILLSIVITAIITTFAVAQNIPNAAGMLPKNVQSFIQQHFKNANVINTEYDDDDFEVRLSNGVKIEFYINGEWKEIKAYGNPLPNSILPAPVLNTLKKQFPNVAVFKVEKEWNGYEISLSNMMQVFIDGNGTFLGQKFDD